MAVVPILVRSLIGPGTVTSPAVVKGVAQEANVALNVGADWDTTPLARVTVNVWVSRDGGFSYEIVDVITTVGGARARDGRLPQSRGLQLAPDVTHLKCDLAINLSLALGVDVELL